MKYYWFHHPDPLTTEEADELCRRYRARGVQVTRRLRPDNVTWEVCARLPARRKAPELWYSR